ncbi:MAG: hypothetical protein JWM47_4518 [Acidimicrobiales bacterium]|nr:hypothetical protein [Acidimicrobiales bacterium]
MPNGQGKTVTDQCWACAGTPVSAFPNGNELGQTVYLCATCAADTDVPDARCPDCASVGQSESLKRLLGEALAEVENGNDPIPAITEALAAAYLEAGEHPASVVIDVAGYEQGLADAEALAVCICPPDLVDRGGFKSGCPVHA